MKKKYLLAGILLLFPILLLSGQANVGDVWCEPGEMYVGIDQVFTTEIHVNAGSRSLATYNLDISYNDWTISIEDIESGNAVLDPIVGLDIGYFIVQAFDPSGISGSDIHLLTLTWKTSRRGASYIDMTAELTDQDTNPLPAILFNGVVHIAREGELWADTDGDNSVTIIDALLTARYYIGQRPAEFIPEVADVNCDSTIDIIDALMIAQYYVGAHADFPCRGLPTPEPSSPPIVFPDPVLEYDIRLEIDKLTGDIYPEDVEAEPELVIYSYNLTDISGLEYFTSLSDLILDTSRVIDLMPLTQLKNLTELNLGADSETDFSPLAEIISLISLTLSYNDLEVIPDLSTLENLQTLFLGNNNLTDLSPLAGLPHLTRLSLDYNYSITDITPLEGLSSLTILILRGTRPADFSPLSKLKHLTILWLQNTRMENLESLSGMTELENLYLDNNLITDLSPLSGLTNLKRITLRYNDISDITPLMGLTNLESLELSGNPIPEPDITLLREALPGTEVIF